MGKIDHQMTIGVLNDFGLYQCIILQDNGPSSGAASQEQIKSYSAESIGDQTSWITILF